MDREKELFMELHSEKGRVAGQAYFLWEMDCIIIDTETTGLEGDVIEIAGKRCKSQDTIIDTLIYTDKEIEDGAFKVHGITRKDLLGKPKITDIFSDLIKNMGGALWTGFNVNFDFKRIESSLSGKFSLDFIEFSILKSFCVMCLASKFFGSTNRYGTISLDSCCNHIGLQRVNSHRAMADVNDTIKILEYMASYYRKMNSEYKTIACSNLK